MQVGAEVADPIVDVRDVVETFRRHGLLTPDWRHLLTSAADALEQLPGSARSADVDRLIPRVRWLLQHGLAQGDPVLEDVSTVAERMLRQTRVPGIPQPEDEHWGFAAT